MQEISLCDVSGITTKAPYKTALIGERHVRIEISDFGMHTFVLRLRGCFASLVLCATLLPIYRLSAEA